MITNSYDFVILFDVKNGNPNGDPGADNMPRINYETNTLWVSDVCLKRKIRNYVATTRKGETPNDIYVSEGSVLNKKHEEAYTKIDSDKLEKKDKIDAAKKIMCAKYFDVRTFGAVMSTGNFSCGKVTGPVQIAIAESLNVAAPIDFNITRMAATKEDENKELNQTMGRKFIVPYALFKTVGYISAPLSEKTGFGKDDVELLWESIIQMFEFDRSAARGEMATRRLIIFRHESPLRNAPAHKLFNLIDVKQIDPEKPATSFTDYEISINVGDVPKGVDLIDHQL